jgi:hypothetical protein
MNKLPMKDIPDQAVPVEAEERGQNGWWKAKKWADHIFARFFGRFGNAKFADNDHNEFATFVGKNIAPLLLRSCLSQLQLLKHGRYCSPRVTHLCPKCPSNCETPGRRWSRLNFILSECVFPLLCMTEDDMQTFHENPHEFVRQLHDIMEDFISPLMAGQSLVRAFAQ